VEARVAAAASVCLEQLAEHVRRGKCGELWQLLLAETEARLDALEAAQQAQQGQQGAGGSAEGTSRSKKRGRVGAKAAATDARPAGTAAAAAAGTAARGVALLSQLAEHGRGCRVEGYEPLFRLAARLVQPEFLAAQGAASSGGGSGGSRTGGGPAAGDDDQQAEGGEVPPLPRGASAVPSDFAHTPLPAQSLRLLLALALGHARVAGASGGPAALARVAPQWAPAFSRAPTPPLLAFIRALISPPGGYDVARHFGQPMLGALGRCLLAGALSGGAHACTHARTPPRLPLVLGVIVSVPWAEPSCIMHHWLFACPVPPTAAS
jgi:U3 small nucleolar RNA-associated protein 20